jgi:hypothetical protein
VSIIVDHPPNFEIIRAVFPDCINHGVLYAYGEHVYNPDGVEIPAALIAHEQVHLFRQMNVFKGPLDWWAQYLTDPKFRYNEELLAHAAEYRARAHGLNRNGHAQLLWVTAQRLIAPLYNYEPPRTLPEAMRDLRAELDK